MRCLHLSLSTVTAPVLPVSLAAALLAAPTPAQYFTEQAAAFDAFGQAVAVGDFDADGFEDLAVGIPGEDRSGYYNVGAIRVYYGGPSGFAAGGEDYLAPGLQGLPLQLMSYQAFGRSMAVGDFDADGLDDLAVGAPGARIGGDYGAGAVVVLFGNAGFGLHGGLSQVLHQDTPGVQGGAEPYDSFGSALCAADFDDDGACDLAIGVPYEKIGSSKYYAGAVNVLFGSAGIGLSGAGDQLWYEGANGAAGTATAYDYYGTALAAGDFDGDGLPDLAIGIPGNDSQGGAPYYSTAPNAGAVHVLFSEPFQGPATTHQRVLYPMVSAYPEFVFTADAAFGSALAAGDFNVDGLDDLAIGSPHERTAILGVHIPNAGVVHFVPGHPTKLLDLASATRLHQDTPGIGGGAEPGDAFGARLAVGNFDFTGNDALVVGAVGEAIGSLNYAGAVHVLYPSSQGPKAAGSQIWYQNVAGIEGTSGAYDRFGDALATGDVTGDGIGDLVIGIRGETVGDHAYAGAVGVLRGTAEDGVTGVGDLLIHEYILPVFVW